MNATVAMDAEHRRLFGVDDRWARRYKLEDSEVRGDWKAENRLWRGTFCYSYAGYK